MTEATGPEPGSAADYQHAHDSSGLSVLSQLKQKREQVVAKAYKDLRVPRWGEPGTDTPEIYVRYRPVHHRIIRRAFDATETKKADKVAAAELRANIDILLAGCVGVFAMIDGERYSLRPGDPHGSWTGFDQDLAENLGCGDSATDTVKALYISDGDILSAASAVAEFSGYKEAEADEETAGE
ncbi:MAG TPA: hypothetical protein VFT75_18260 [Nocardioidaceae bacterium]|nr:hypothetical protein [Nocardioidaceae bacterium]